MDGPRDDQSTVGESIIAGTLGFGGGTPTVTGLTIDGFRLEDTALVNNGARINGKLTVTNTVVAGGPATYFFISVGTGSGHELELSNSNITYERGFSIENGQVNSALITNNVFNTDAANLISASALDGVVTLTDNEFNSPRGVNILTNDNTITGNDFNIPAGANNRGMDLYEVKDNVITGNTFSGGGLGINIRSGGRGETDVSDNTVENNILGPDSFYNNLSYDVNFGSNTIDGVVFDSVIVKANSGDVEDGG